MTVRLADELDARLRQEALSRGVTISDVIRQALDEHLGGRAELTDLARRADVTSVVARARLRSRATGSRMPATRILAHRDASRR